MIFLDTNVLLDVLEAADTPEADWSRRSLAAAAERQLITNMIVAAELAGMEADPGSLQQSLSEAEIELVDLDFASAHRAGIAHREYRRRGGARTTIVADFLIGAHASVLGAALLTRDRGFRSYFPELSMITPETHP